MKCESEHCLLDARYHKYDVFVCDAHKDGIWAIKTRKALQTHGEARPRKQRPYNGRY